MKQLKTSQVFEPVSANVLCSDEDRLIGRTWLSLAVDTALEKAELDLSPAQSLEPVAPLRRAAAHWQKILAVWLALQEMAHTAA